MKTFFIGAIALFMTHSACAQELINTSSPQKFKRALVLSGGGFQTPIFLGILDAALKLPEDQRPDVIIATCGGSVASAIAKALPDPDERKEYLMGPGYFDFLQSLKIDQGGFFDLVGGYLRISGHAGQKPSDWTVPEVFSNIMMEIPQDPSVMPAVNIPFEVDGLPIILIAGETSFGPEDVKRKLKEGEKLFTQTFFTDSETANRIGGFEAAVSSPTNLIRAETQIRTDRTLFEASRASISDFYGTNLMEIDGKYYVTGAIDLYPLEFAHHIADEVIMTYKKPFNSLMAKAMESIFRYDTNERLRRVHKGYADYWIDVTDTDEMSDIEFGPKLTKLSTFLPIKAKIALDIPSDLDDYQRRFNILYDYGIERLNEAVSQTRRNEKCHIRNKEIWNTNFTDPIFDECPNDRPVFHAGTPLYEALEENSGDFIVNSLGEEQNLGLVDFIGGQIVQLEKEGYSQRSLRIACLARNKIFGKCKLAQFVEIKKINPTTFQATPLQSNLTIGFSELPENTGANRRFLKDIWIVKNNRRNNLGHYYPEQHLMISASAIYPGEDVKFDGDDGILFFPLDRPKFNNELSKLFQTDSFQMIDAEQYDQLIQDLTITLSPF